MLARLLRPLLLLATCCRLSLAVHIYLSPAPSSYRSTLAPDDATTALSRHLGLDAFEHFRDESDSSFSEEWFVGQGHKGVLLLSVEESDVEAILPPSLLRPAFTLATPPLTPIESLDSVISAYVHRASSVFSDVFSSYHFGDSDDVAKLVDFIQDPTEPSFAAVELSKLHDIGQKHGKSSPAYTEAAEQLRSLLESMIIEDDKNSFAILTYATRSSASLVKRDVPQESQVPFPLPDPQQPIGAISTCFTSMESCNNSTSSCSGRGKCAEASKAGRTCFVCTCGVTKTGEGDKVKTTYWAGESCERKDISSPFVLITGTVIVIILLFVGAVSLLYSVGDQSLPSTLLATAVPVKKD